MKIINSFFAILTIITIISCQKQRGRVTYGQNGIIVSGKGKVICSKPLKTYAKEMDLQVKAKIDALQNVPAADLDTKIKTTVITLTDYSTQGLDRDLLLFRICEMSTNRGFTGEQTASLIEKAMNAYEEELKKKK